MKITAKVALGQGIKKNVQSIRAYDAVTGADITSTITYMTLRNAFNAGKWLENSSGKWRQTEPGRVITSKPTTVATPSTPADNTVMALLNTCVEKRPASLYCQDLTWKFICRAILKGRNILLTGPTGCGKSQTAIAAAKALNKELFYVNLGATQDPRGTLIGNTHFSKEVGTYFNESAFVKAIQAPNTVILLDEVSRAHPEAHNILMTVLDPGQRYLRLDEAANTPTIKVAEGVSFIGTANIGSEYTATRVMDRALIDRFTIAEIPFLTSVEECALIQQIHPTIDPTIAVALSEIALQTRNEVRSDSAKIQTPLSTRSILEMADLLVDGFTLEECAEVCIYPLYSQDGGLQSERTFVKQVVQKFINDGTSDSLTETKEEEVTYY